MARMRILTPDEWNEDPQRTRLGECAAAAGLVVVMVETFPADPRAEDDGVALVAHVERAAFCTERAVNELVDELMATAAEMMCEKLGRGWRPVGLPQLEMSAGLRGELAT